MNHFMKVLFLGLFFSFFLLAADFSSEKRHALYLLHTGEVAKAIDKYQKICLEENKADFEILQQMALMIMREGSKSSDEKDKILAIYGAGLALNSLSIEILEQGLINPNPELQMIALFFIGQLPDSKADELLVQAMSSDYLSTRMEACFHLAQRKHPQAIAYMEALMQRLPPFFRPFFPQLFGILGTSDAVVAMQRFLDDPDPLVRIETIHTLLKTGRDDFLPVFQKKVHNANIAEKEAILFAFGLFKDSSSLPLLKSLATSTEDTVRLAAYKSLHMLGDPTAKGYLEKSAFAQDLYAVSALGDVAGSEDTLYFLMYSSNPQVRINATIALLKRRDPRCLPELENFLLSSQVALHPTFSIGKAHMAFKVVNPAHLNAKDSIYPPGLYTHIKETLIREAINLGENVFLSFAETLLQAKQNDLVPEIFSLLENLRTDKAIAFLKKQSQKVGAPLIRNYASLALFRLKEEGPYEEVLATWIKEGKDKELIQLRPHLAAQERMEISEYTLSAEESSRLLVETFSAFAQRQDEKSIMVVLDAIKTQKKNRFALSGLLLRAIE